MRSPHRTPLLPLFLLLFLGSTLRAQDPSDAGLVTLARIYHGTMFRNEPTAEQLEELRSSIPAELAKARDVIVESIRTKNSLLDDRFLMVPDEATLRQIHAVKELHHDMAKDERRGDSVVLDSLKAHPASRYLLVDEYYHLIFTSVGNKNRPFDLSKLDLRLDRYGLLDDTERNILFLRCMDLCRSVIWGYLNIVDPPNTKEAKKHIKRYPKVNGAVYWTYNELAFTDFDFVFSDSLQSYKGVMIDKYLELLLFQLVVLDKEGAKEEQVQDLLLGSAMRKENLWKYTKYRAAYENIFRKP